MKKVHPNKAEKKRQKMHERKKAKGQKLMQDKISSMLREIKYGQRSAKILDRVWYEIYSKYGGEQKKYLKFVIAIFEKIVDLKDFAISLLMDDLYNNEEEYQNNLEKHHEHVASLLLHYQKNSINLSYEFLQQLREKRRSNRTHTRIRQQSSRQEEVYLKSLLYQDEIKLFKEMQDAQVDFFCFLNDTQNVFADTSCVYQAFAGSKTHRIWNNAQKVIGEYDIIVKKNKKKLGDVFHRDSEQQTILKEQSAKCDQLFRALTKHQQQLERLKYLNDLNIIELERNSLSESFFALKNKLQSDLKHYESKIKTLVSGAESALQCLIATCRRTKFILSMFTVCKKLETLEERILPFPVEEECDEKFTNLELFYQRVGQAAASRLDLIKQRNFLKTENDKLKNVMNRFMFNHSQMVPRVNQCVFFKPSYSKQYAKTVKLC